MPNLNEFHTIALSLPEVSVEPHFEKASYRVKKKIFATLNDKEGWATLKFTPEEQQMFVKIKAEAIFAVPNKWGKLGWTHLKYDLLSDEIVDELLKVAYCNIAPKNLQEQVKFSES